MMCVLEDEDTQKHGVVLLMYYMGGLRRDDDHDPDIVYENVRASRWLPFRYAAIHMCASTLAMRAIFNLVRVLTSTHNRSVMRIHEGSYA